MMEWQPIETAPRDGTPVLLWPPHPWSSNWRTSTPSQKMHAWVGQWMDMAKGWVASPCEATEYEPETQNPTLWQPLPEPPES